MWYIDYFNGTDKTVKNPNVIKLYKYTKSKENKPGDYKDYQEAQKKYQEAQKKYQEAVNNIKDDESLTIENKKNLDSLYDEIKKTKQAAINAEDNYIAKLDKKNNLICSAPYNQEMSFSASNNYTSSAAGIFQQILEAAAQGTKDGTLLVGSGAALISQMTDLFAKNSNINEVMQSNTMQQKISNLLKTGNKEIVMPWKDLLDFRSTDLSYSIPSISYTVVSTEKDKVVNEINFIKYNLFGTVYNSTAEGWKALVESGMEIKQPSAVTYNGSSIAQNMAKVNNRLGVRVFDDCLYAVIESGGKKITIPNLLPSNVTIQPSKYRTFDGDFAWATINIELKKASMVTTDMLNSCIEGTIVTTDT